MAGPTDAISGVLSCGAIGGASRTIQTHNPKHPPQPPTTNLQESPHESPLRPYRDARLALEIGALRRRLSVDFIHLVAIKPITLGLASNVIGTSPVVCTFAGLGSALNHEASPSALARAVSGVIRIGAASAGAFAIVQNDDDRREVGERFRFPPSRIRVIEGSGIESDDYPVRQLTAGPGSATFAFAGRLIADKGVRELVKALIMVREQVPLARLLLIGDGDETNPSSLSASELGEYASLPGVVMLGRLARPGALKLLSKSDVAVLPSYREGLPRFLLEAACFGIPLIGA